MPTDDPQERVTFDQEAYEAEVQRFNELQLRRAAAFQAAGTELAGQGRQRAARQAFESAWYYSLSDAALNEDARVQLHQLAQDQALVGLIESRDQLRALGAPGTAPGGLPGGFTGEDGSEDVLADRVQRLRNGLGREDADNLSAIINRVVETQSTAATTAVPLAVQMPRRGRVLRLYRSVLVSPNEPMVLSFRPHRPVTAGAAGPVGVGLGVFFVAVARRVDGRPGAGHVPRSSGMIRTLAWDRPSLACHPSSRFMADQLPSPCRAIRHGSVSFHHRWFAGLAARAALSTARSSPMYSA